MRIKYIIFLIILILGNSGQLRKISQRLFDWEVFWMQQIENSSREAEILKGLSSYDYSQAKENAGRLFIRDKIIFP